MVNRKTKQLLSIITLSVLIILTIIIFGTSRAFAFSEGPGSGGGTSNSADCASPNGSLYWNQKVCGNNTGGGSWHIFRTTSSWYSGSEKCKSVMGDSYKSEKGDCKGLYKGSKAYPQPEHGPRTSDDGLIAPLEGGGYKHNLADQCTNKEHANYYVAFVLDGWNGKADNGDRLNVPHYWGPVAWPGEFKHGGDTKKVHYHSEGTTHSWTDVYNKLKVGDYNSVNAWRLTKLAAKKLYNLGLCGKLSGCDLEKTDIKDGIGWFCGKEVKDVNLRLYAVTTSGQLIYPNPIDQNTVSQGSEAKVTAHGKGPGAPYTLVRYDGCDKTTTENGVQYCAKTLNQDENVYAVYTLPPSYWGNAEVWTPSEYAATGWTQYDSIRYVDTECWNSGCNAEWHLSLKNDAESYGKFTNYYIGNVFGVYAWNSLFWESSPKVVANGSDRLYPGGENSCHYMKFQPYWPRTLDDNTWVDPVGVCARAKVTNFEAKASVTGDASTSVGWTRNTSEQTAYINNCSPTAGCKVRFNHEIRRDTGALGSTNWTVKRTSNMGSINKNLTGINPIGDQTMTSRTLNSDYDSFADNEYTLYPGAWVCEEISFKPNNNYYNPPSNATIKVCASALGNAQPGDTDGDNALLDIKIRNNDGADRYKSFQREVYAKPGDNLYYRSTYHPILQYTYFLKPQQMRINGGSIYNGNNTMGNMFNQYKGDLKNWNNALSIQEAKLGTNPSSPDFSGTSAKETKVYTLGSTAKQTIPNATGYNKKVDQNYVGKVFTPRAITNLVDNGRTTPSQVSFAKNGNKNLGNVITKQLEKRAGAIIPYNYINQVVIDDSKLPEDQKNDPGTNPDGSDSETRIVFAGEVESNIQAKLKVENKTNSLTTNGSPAYSTKLSDQTKYRFIVYYGGNEKEGGLTGVDPSEDALCNHFGKPNNQTDCGLTEAKFIDQAQLTDKTITLAQAFSIQDLDAGSRICVAAAVYPATSGADSSIDPNGDHKWRISKSNCYTIAKKPSLQAWGGNVYTGGGIKTNLSVKTNLARLDDYQVFRLNNKDGKYYVFGSWGENGVLANGTVKNFASAASLGYAKNNGGSLYPNKHPDDGRGNTAAPVGGNTDKDFCAQSRLSFANTSCSGSNGTSGNIGILTNSSQISQNVEQIIAKLIRNTEPETESTTVSSGNSDYVSAKDIEISGWSQVNSYNTFIIHAKNNVYISGNISYGNSQYLNLSEIPKVVVYAEKGDINIKCEVTKIDALLIAKNGTVRTCADKYGNTGNYNNRDHSYQLTVFGAIIAEKLEANRTYGAAVGANSMVPAEIINFDPSLYMWAGSDTNESHNSGGLEAVYTDEVAPRL